jgi:hypothetical protein
VIPAVPLEARENETMMAEAELWPPHPFVIDTGNAWVTGDGTLENIPRPANAESTTKGEDPLKGTSPV